MGKMQPGKWTKERDVPWPTADKPRAMLVASVKDPSEDSALHLSSKETQGSVLSLKPSRQITSQNTGPPAGNIHQGWHTVALAGFSLCTQWTVDREVSSFSKNTHVCSSALRRPSKTHNKASIRGCQTTKRKSTSFFNSKGREVITLYPEADSSGKQHSIEELHDWDSLNLTPTSVTCYLT